MLDDAPVWRVWLSQHCLPVVTVACEVGVLEALPATTAEAAAALGGVCARTLNAMLHVLASLSLVETPASTVEAWALSAHGRAFLMPDSPTYGGPYLLSSSANAEAHERLRTRLFRPPPAHATERAWAANTFSGDAHRAEACIVHMHALHAPTAIRSARTLARVICERCYSRRSADADGAASGADTPSPLRVLDAGAGSGVFSVCLAKESERLLCDAADLQEVIDAVARLAYIPDELAKSGRVRPRELNFFADEHMAWPCDYDAVLFSSILHDWDDTACAELLRRAYRALRPGGVCLVHEVSLDQPDAESRSLAACLGLHMCLYTTGGRQRRTRELHELMIATGFERPITLPTSGAFSVTSATRS